MGDLAPIFNAMKYRRRELRRLYGVECPECKARRPRANASILLPGQKCKVDGYVDIRPRLTEEQLGRV